MDRLPGVVNNNVSNSSLINVTDTPMTEQIQNDLSGINDISNHHKSEIKLDQEYGWFNIRPKFLQCFLSAKWALFWLCWAGALQGLVVNGCINVVITTIERRFGLRSSQTGLVASGYDISSFICLVPVTYFGGRLYASKPRWLGWGVILMGLGSLTFALPHFLVGPYKTLTSAESNVCNGDKNMNDCSNDPLQSTTENVSWNIWFFFTAQLLHGAGASPLFTLGVTYIDENVSKKMSSVYLGIYYTMAIIGPAIGYVVGGQLLLFYTDFMIVDSLTLGLTPESKVWVGAWWISFVFIAALCLLLSIPIFAYPSSLPGSLAIQQGKVSEAHNGNTSSTSNQRFTKLKEMPKAIYSLLRNPTFFFLNLSAASEGLIIAGFAAFLPKLIENQFSVTPVYSSMLMGLITVPAGGGGTFFGGYLVKKFNLTCAGIIKLCLFTTIIATFFTICFFLSCPNLIFAGVTSPYLFSYFSTSSSSSSSSSATAALSAVTLPSVSIDAKLMDSQFMDKKFGLDSLCNNKCGCNKRNYDPICGIDGVMYYSPCYAGCTKELSIDNAKVYLNCDCIIVPNNTLDRGYDAINTMCHTTCNNLWFFIGLCFFVMLFTFLATMPALSATLRCVHDDQRSFALGIQWIKVRILGTIPAPMIFGRLIDETCILWQDSCDNTGSCLVYDNNYMSKYMLTLAIIGKACSIIFFFGAWWYYIPPKQQATTKTGNDLQTFDQSNGNTNHNSQRF